MKINENFILREIAGDYVIIPVGSMALSINGLISVNEIGAFLWKKLQEEITMDALVASVLAEYDVDEATARVDVSEFVEQLREKNILE